MQRPWGGDHGGSSVLPLFPAKSPGGQHNIVAQATLPGPTLHLPVPGDDSNATVTEKGFTLCACFHFSQTTKVFPGIWVQLQAVGAAGGGGGGREKARAEASQLRGGCAWRGAVPSPCGVAAAKAGQTTWITRVAGALWAQRQGTIGGCAALHGMVGSQGGLVFQQRQLRAVEAPGR